MPGIQPDLVHPYYVHFAQGAEVEIDPETGQIAVTRLVDAHDPGRAISPTNCYGQIEGGLAMGLGFAMTEEIVLDRGRTVNPSFIDYKIPRSTDVPALVPVLKEKLCHLGPFGAKAIGEGTTVHHPQHFDFARGRPPPRC